MPEPTQMISVEEALSFILSHFESLEPEAVYLLDAQDRVLAEDIFSDVAIPPFDNTSMDGYAVRATDTVGASPETPVTLRVVADVPAGVVADVPVGPGEAARIMTGAPLPEGADAIVPVEETDKWLSADQEPRGKGATVRVLQAARVGANVRLAGGDMQPGDLVLPRGTAVRPAEIAVLATLGRSHAAVIRRPRVAVLATGDELLDIDQPLVPGKIRNSNEYSNAALVARYGGIPVRLGIARDTVADLTAKIHAGLAQGVDLFLTSAGVSVGDYDVVKDVLKAEGEIRFWKVKMKPGKPLAFGTVQGVPLLGLPGNPTSAMVSFEQFARPAILKMQGRTRLAKPTVQAILDDPLQRGDRRGYLRVIVHRDENGVYHARTAGMQVSGFISAMARANGLAIVPEGEGQLIPGTRVTVQMLNWPEVE
ncbi:MAG: molybdopterin molybdotransferase MoeA [Anaerolineae bacterium]|nr:MAG: molybdopterin molybdotransferase MoeA [Anaerolineae bacterium]